MKMKLSMVIMGLMVSASAFAGANILLMTEQKQELDISSKVSGNGGNVIGGAAVATMPRDLASGVDVASPQVLSQPQLVDPVITTQKESILTQ